MILNICEIPTISNPKARGRKADTSGGGVDRCTAHSVQLAKRHANGGKLAAGCAGSAGGGATWGWKALVFLGRAFERLSEMKRCGVEPKNSTSVDFVLSTEGRMGHTSTHALRSILTSCLHFCTSVRSAQGCAHVRKLAVPLRLQSDRTKAGRGGNCRPGSGAFTNELWVDVYHYVR